MFGTPRRWFRNPTPSVGMLPLVLLAFGCNKVVTPETHDQEIVIQQPTEEETTEVADLDLLGPLLFERSMGEVEIEAVELSSGKGRSWYR